MISKLSQVVLCFAAVWEIGATASSLDEPTSGLTITVGYEKTGSSEFGIRRGDYATATKQSFDGTEFAIYENGEVRPRWKECVEGDNCYVMGALMDRVSFDLVWQPEEGSEPIFDQPTVEVDAQSTISASIIPSELNGNDGSGSFGVKFDCAQSAGKRTKAVVSVRLSESETAVFAWMKVCGSGVHPTAEVGLFQLDDEFGTRVSGLATENGEYPLEDKAFTGIPVYALVRPPGTYQRYLKPELESADQSIITIRCDGHDEGGQLSLSNPVTMYVKYDCKKNGTTELTMTLPIPPFEPLVGRWRKRCVIPDEKVGTAKLGVALNDDEADQLEVRCGLRQTGETLLLMNDLGQDNKRREL